MTEETKEPDPQPSTATFAATASRRVASFLAGAVIAAAGAWGLVSAGGWILPAFNGIDLPDGVVMVLMSMLVGLSGIAVGATLWSMSKKTNRAFARGAIVGALVPFFLFGACMIELSRIGFVGIHPPDAQPRQEEKETVGE